MDGSKAFIAVTSYYYAKTYATILNSFSWPQSGEEQDVLNQINTQIGGILASLMAR